MVFTDVSSDICVHVKHDVLDSIINPRRMREGYGTWFVIRSFILSNELQRPSLTSKTRSRYKQA